MVDASANIAFLSMPFAWFSAQLERMREARERRILRRSIELELSFYSDRELDDMGIARADIPRIASDAV